MSHLRIQMLLFSQNDIYKYNKDYVIQYRLIAYVALTKTNVCTTRNLEDDYVTISVYYHIIYQEYRNYILENIEGLSKTHYKLLSNSDFL